MTFGQALYNKLVELRLPPEHLYVRYYPVYPIPIEGCTEQQLQEIKIAQGVQYLPYLYEEFLRFMGVSSGDLFIGMDSTYAYLKSGRMKQALQNLLDKDNFSQILEPFFVFMSQQGHSFWYFKTGQNSDPEVFLYTQKSGLLEEDEANDNPFRNGPILVGQRLSQFLTQFIQERESIKAKENLLIQYGFN